MSHKIEISADIINVTTLRFWVDATEWDNARHTSQRAMVYDAFVKATEFKTLDSYKGENEVNPVFVTSEEGATLPNDFDVMVYDPKNND